MKCKNCGHILNVEEGTSTITCEYCHTTYALDDEAQHIKYDNMYESGYEFEKGRMQAQDEQVEKAGKVVKGFFGAHIIISIISVIFFILFVIVFMTIVYNIHQSSINHNNFSLNMKKDSFNSSFEMYSGTQTKFFIERLLDDIAINNRKDSFNTITVVYNDISTSDPNEITNIKHSLEESPAKYEVSFNYNGAGVIYKVVIEDITN